MISSAAEASRPVVGSSAKTREGRCASSMAKATRRSWPPESESSVWALTADGPPEPPRLAKSSRSSTVVAAPRRRTANEMASEAVKQPSARTCPTSCGT
mmetsp:Transcript_6397/g.20510  ORF Transcript_6397/g.20510 Transcript_6397/m.20510 type:complete len:99 (+) Transcript_6397:354-650(+)